MSNKGFWDDTFEKAVEAGQSMAKGGAKQIKQTFNPLQMMKNTAESEKNGEGAVKQAKERQQNGKDNSTPLDFDKLQKSYAGQDDQEAKVLANRLFQLVKSGEEKVLTEEKQKEAEKMRQEAYAKQQKKQQETAAQQQQAAELPQGKERKSILGGKKKKSGAPPATAELKPSQSKQ